MVQAIEEVLLKPGATVHFENRDDLLQILVRLDQAIPARHEGRNRDHREHFQMVRYLRFLSAADLLEFPVTLAKIHENQDPPDFTLRWRDGRIETFELTEGSTQQYQRQLAKTSTDPHALPLPVDINTPRRKAADMWADVLFAAFVRKADTLLQGRFRIDHLLIYDLTGLGLFVPLGLGGPLLRTRVQEWNDQEECRHRFGRLSVLRDLALLLDVAGEGRILTNMESNRFRVPTIRATDEEDLKRRLVELDRYCRANSIRHLKAFGSVLGDRDDRFRETSDVDLLVEFEPATRVTLLDMARMERELSDLIGFEVDLRTADDLSRYFRQDVLDEAVELGATGR